MKEFSYKKWVMSFDNFQRSQWMLYQAWKRLKKAISKGFPFKQLINYL